MQLLTWLRNINKICYYYCTGEAGKQQGIVKPFEGLLEQGRAHKRTESNIMEEQQKEKW